MCCRFRLTSVRSMRLWLANVFDKANFKLIYQILTLSDKYLDHEDPDWLKWAAPQNTDSDP